MLFSRFSSFLQPDFLSTFCHGHDHLCRKSQTKKKQKKPTSMNKQKTCRGIAIAVVTLKVKVIPLNVIGGNNPPVIKKGTLLWNLSFFIHLYLMCGHTVLIMLYSSQYKITVTTAQEED